VRALLEGEDRSQLYADITLYVHDLLAKHRQIAAFHVVLFDDRCNDGRRMMAIVFEEDGHCAVLDVAKLAAGDIKFGSNSWRGDEYHWRLRNAIDEHQWRPS
jgi:hypothetical protein